MDKSNPILVSSFESTNKIESLLSRISQWSLAALTLLASTLAVASLTWPFGWDQGIFSWVGEVINRGGMPYREAWDTKGPLAFYLYALAERLFGRNLWGIRLVDILFVLIAAVFLAVLLAELTNPQAARWAAVLFSLWYASGNYWHTAQPDGWAGLFILIGMAPVLRPNASRSTIKWMFAGLMIGCAFLIKPLFGLFSLLPMLLIWLERQIDRKQRLIDWVLILSGLALPLLVCAGWFAYRGALQDLLDVWLVYTFKIYCGIDTLSIGSRLKGVAEYLFNGQVISAALPIVGLGVFSLWRRARAKAVVLVVWMGAAIAIVAAQNRFFLYHWIILYPPVTILGAAGLQAVFSSVSTRLQHDAAGLNRTTVVLGVLILGVLILQAAIHPVLEAANWAAYSLGLKSKIQYYDGFGSPGAVMEATEYIQQHSQPEDSIFVWGMDASIYYFSDRDCSNRLCTSLPLMVGAGTPTRAAYRQEFLESLAASPPAFIAVEPLPDLILGGHYELSDFPEFERLLSVEYEPVAEYGEIAIFRQKTKETDSIAGK